MTMIQAMGRAQARWGLLLAALGSTGCGSDTANVGELTDESHRSNSSSSDGSGGSNVSGAGGVDGTNSNSSGSENVSNASNTTSAPPPRTCDDLGDALDSRWLVFDSDAGAGESERRIYAMEAKAGAIPQPLTPENVLAREPTLSPDGSELAYVADGMVRVLNLVSGDDEALVAGDQPAWSPDGQSLAYHAARGVWLFDWEAEVSRELATCNDCSLGGYQNPEFSREGDVVVMDRENQIELMDLETGDTHRVVQNGTMSMHHPTLSPDGGTVLAALECEPSSFSLWLHEAQETTNPCEGRRLLPDGTFEKPNWGPNSVIAFERPHPEMRDIVLFDIDAELGCLLEFEGINQNPSWAPHGWQPPGSD